MAWQDGVLGQELEIALRNAKTAFLSVKRRLKEEFDLELSDSDLKAALNTLTEELIPGDKKDAA